MYAYIFLVLSNSCPFFFFAANVFTIPILALRCMFLSLQSGCGATVSHSVNILILRSWKTERGAVGTYYKWPAARGSAALIDLFLFYSFPCILCALHIAQLFLSNLFFCFFYKFSTDCLY